MIGALVLAALVPILSACGTHTTQASGSAAATGESPAARGMHKESIGPDYLWIPKSADTGKSPQLQVAGTQYGVVIALPPSYAPLPGNGQPSRSWTVYLAHPTTGGQNLLETATRLAALPRSARDLVILGVTGPYALFSAQSSTGATLDLLSLQGAEAGTVRDMGPVASSYGAAVAVRGQVFWLGAGGRVHVLDTATGGIQVSQASGLSAPLSWSRSGLFANIRQVTLPGVELPASPALPAGFQWISIGQSLTPIAAVPQGFTVQQIAGGSSHGLVATDPKDASLQVTIYENACAGCYNPGVSAPGANTLSTPIYVGTEVGTEPLGDHGLLSEIKQKSGLETYMLVVDYLQGGDLEASVTVPKAQGALAREILQTVWLPW
jgi:hypothetical protein